jgi:hypothetical protein
MKSISEIWDIISRSATVQYPAFPIPPGHVVSPKLSNIGFKADEAYFELRICEQFLRDRREYWNEYNPLTLAFSEFIYGGARRSFPFVVGPGILKGLEQLEGDERVRYRNTRVAGPIPYRGDSVAISVGLFRVKTRDWARQALSLLESVAKAFDSSKLTNYLNITEPLMDGIESFLGMKDQMQFRLGQRDEFVDPETHVGNVFSPGYFVTIRGDEQKIEKEKFWIKENQLYIGENASHLQSYREQDYILYQISLFDKRNDYTTFDFHRQWEDVQNQIWNGNGTTAIEGYQRLIALIRRSSDLIPSHMNELQLMYRAKFQEESDAYKRSRDPTISITELGTTMFSKSFERMSHINVDKDAVRAITKSRDYFLEGASIRSQIRGPAHLKEEDIRAALSSPILNDPSVKSIEPDKLAAALSLEMPIV